MIAVATGILRYRAMFFCCSSHSYRVLYWYAVRILLSYVVFLRFSLRISHSLWLFIHCFFFFVLRRLSLTWLRDDSLAFGHILAHVKRRINIQTTYLRFIRVQDKIDESLLLLFD